MVLFANHIKVWIFGLSKYPTIMQMWMVNKKLWSNNNYDTMYNKGSFRLQENWSVNQSDIH